MRKEETELITLMGRISKFIKCHGKGRLYEILDSVNPLAKVEDPYKKLMGFILSKSCEVYGIKEKEISKKSANGDCSEAKKLAMFLMYDNVPTVSQKDIAKMFDLSSHTSVYIAVKEFSNLNPKVKTDRDRIEKKEALERVIDKYKESTINQDYV